MLRSICVSDKQDELNGITFTLSHKQDELSDMRKSLSYVRIKTTFCK